VWEQLRFGSKNSLWVIPFPPPPETSETLLALRERAGRIWGLMVSTGSSLKFNLQKRQGTSSEDTSFSSKGLLVEETASPFKPCLTSTCSPPYLHPLTTMTSAQPLLFFLLASRRKLILIQHLMTVGNKR